MEEIKLTKPTGEESYKVLSAFKANGMDFVVLDSKLKDQGNGNTITFISQIEGDELKVVEGENWNIVRNALITIVKGMDSDYEHKVPFEFINVASEYKAEENVGHTLGLKDAHVESISSQYKAFAENENTVEAAAPVVETATPAVEEIPAQSEETATVEEATPVAPEAPVAEEVVTEESTSEGEETSEAEEENKNPLDNAIDNANTTQIDIAAIGEAANAMDAQNTDAAVEAAPEITEAPTDVTTSAEGENVDNTEVNPVIDIQEAPVAEEAVESTGGEESTEESTEETIEDSAETEETTDTVEEETENTEEEMPVINVIDEALANNAGASEETAEEENKTESEVASEPEVAVEAATPVTPEAPAIDLAGTVNVEETAGEEVTAQPEGVVTETVENVEVNNGFAGLDEIKRLSSELDAIYNDFTKKANELMETYKAVNEIANKTFQNAQAAMNTQPENAIPFEQPVQEEGVQRTLVA